MDNFELDNRLAKDCLVLGGLDFSLLLLLNNSLVPWFILVPQTSVTELIDLSNTDQARMLAEINLIANFTKNHFDISKLNIAAIGNIVSQLHVHVVGRDPSDYCWPKVVWGTQEKEPYSSDQIEVIRSALMDKLGERFIPLGKIEE